MFQKLATCQLLLETVKLEIVEQILREVNEAKLGKLGYQIAHLLQTVVISELAEAFQADLS